MKTLLLALLVFCVPFAAAQTATESAVYTFCGPNEVCTDGAYPQSSLVQGSDGNFYGTTPSGGAYGLGEVFKVSNGTESVLYSFSGGSDGSVPYAGVIQASDGNLYGVTYGDGSVAFNGPGQYACLNVGQCGTIFRLDLYGDLKTLYTFCNQQNCADGFNPADNLVQGSDGNLYGSTRDVGNVFRISLNGDFTNIVSSDSGVLGALVQASDGNFYASGAGGSDGTILQITPAGALSAIATFTGGSDGEMPVGALIEGSDGNLYGTTAGGGTYDEGTIFQATLSGALTVLKSFCESTDGSCHDGYFPNGGLFLGSDGNFYGTTIYGGLNSDCTEQYEDGNTGCGAVFDISVSGQFSSLYNFIGMSDGSLPYSGLLQASDGNFYGTTTGIGDSNPTYSDGNVYEISLAPSLSPPVQLTLSNNSINSGDGVTLDWSVLNAFSDTMQQCYAFVQNNATGAGTWTGLQTGTLANGVYSGSATIVPTAEGYYTYALTCGGTESGYVSLTVGSKATTYAGLSATSPVTLGSYAMLTANVSTTENVGTITGSVTFSSAGLVLGTVNLSGGSASLNAEAAGIPTGTYPVRATYSGDVNYQSSSATKNIVVLGYATSASISTSTSTVTQGKSLKLSSIVTRTGVGGTPTGSVTFYYGSSALGKAILKKGVASLSVPNVGNIPTGTYTIRSVYSGDSTDQSATSATVSVTVIAATTTSLTASPNPAPPDHAITLAADVKESYGSAIPTGSVTFTVGNYVVGIENLDGTGTAVLNASDAGFAAGKYPVTAVYSGDSMDAGSTSAAVIETVQ